MSNEHYVLDFADSRLFRDVRIHKTRIWMACLGGSYLLTEEAERPLEMPQYRP